MAKTAIFPGSFDPFTNGHLDIVKKAARLFDTVYVIIAENIKKQRMIPAEKMKAAVEQSLISEGLSNCKVLICGGLVADFARELSASYMIRGLRNSTDYKYEEETAEINRILNSELEYIYFRAEKKSVSSSMVKELFAFGHDVSDFLPAPVMVLMKTRI